MNAFVDPVEEFKAACAGLDAAHRFTDAELEVVYSLAFNLYSSGRYLEALKYFQFLSLYRPVKARFLKGLAACQYMSQQYQEASTTSSLLVLLDPNDAEALFLNGQALLMTGETEDAKLCLQHAASLPGDKGPERAKALLELIAH